MVLLTCMTSIPPAAVWASHLHTHAALHTSLSSPTKGFTESGSAQLTHTFPVWKVAEELIGGEAFFRTPGAGHRASRRWAKQTVGAEVRAWWSTRRLSMCVCLCLCVHTHVCKKLARPYTNTKPLQQLRCFSHHPTSTPDCLGEIQNFCLSVSTKFAIRRVCSAEPGSGLNRGPPILTRWCLSQVSTLPASGHAPQMHHAQCCMLTDRSPKPPPGAPTVTTSRTHFTSAWCPTQPVLCTPSLKQTAGLTPIPGHPLQTALVQFPQ